jgi:hypothetical protein
VLVIPNALRRRKSRAQVEWLAFGAEGRICQPQSFSCSTTLRAYSSDGLMLPFGGHGSRPRSARRISARQRRFIIDHGYFTAAALFIVASAAALA